MRAWHFSENAYPYLPPAESYPSIRVSLPNRIYDPEKGAALYDRFIEEWLIAEDEGVEIMLNEHHQPATCVDPAAPLMLAALARLSNKARLLILGNPIANRRQPVRVAEEMAMIDVLSRGRLEAANPPGYLPVAMNVQLARGAHNVVSAYGTKQSTVEGAIEAGTLFAGTPDQVFQQIKNHWKYVGGYGHLLIMGQAGFLEHDDTVHGIRMFAREVYPRLKQFSPDSVPSGTFEQSTAAAH
jgi:alkanesulfonate monooxygenase SsuD/methylene tetrahydromethanopterin reductase-like flavin-dependent oxidoreductase (luciferase family)